MMKMYICVLDEVPDNMVPVLVAHTVLGADMHFRQIGEHPQMVRQYQHYLDWKHNSFKKCVVAVDRKQFNKIIQSCPIVYLGHENKTLNGDKSCIVVLPVFDDDVPKVLKYCKLWSPKNV